MEKEKQNKKQIEDLWKYIGFPIGVASGILIAVIVTWIYKGISCIV